MLLDIIVHLVSWLVKPVSECLNYKIECLIVDLPVAIFSTSVKISTASTNLKLPRCFALSGNRRRLYIELTSVLKNLGVNLNLSSSQRDRRASSDSLVSLWPSAADIDFS